MDREIPSAVSIASLRPVAVIWAYWKEVLVIEEQALLLDPVYVVIS